MPNSPGSLCLDCGSRAIAGSKFCTRHQTDNSATARKDRKRQFDRDRQDDPIRKLYRCQRWYAVRQTVLNRDILCQACGHQAATEVDHILRARLVVDNFGVNEFYNTKRLQGLCHKCHSIKTNIEAGWTGGKGTALEQLSDRSNTTVVCGPAASGKSTYVKQHMQTDDVQWDYDEVMREQTGLPLHESLPDAVGSVLALRDQFINNTAHCPHHVWIIVTRREAAVVKLLEDAGARVIVMNTPDDVCQQRLRERFIAANK